MFSPIRLVKVKPPSVCSSLIVTGKLYGAEHAILTIVYLESANNNQKLAITMK